MAKYRKKPKEIEAITFDELVEYGKETGANIINGMPWSFEYKGRAVTHENDECYLILTLNKTIRFTPDELLTEENGIICTYKSDLFEQINERR